MEQGQPQQGHAGGHGHGHGHGQGDPKLLHKDMAHERE
jgi:hypothetical protein